MPDRRPPHRLVLASLTLLALASPPLARAIQVQAGIGFIAITDGTPGGQIILSDTKGKELGRAVTDSFGSLIIRDLPQGERFLVTDAAAPGSGQRVTVLNFADNPPPAFYKKQTLVEGFQYIEARDGTLLAAMVRPPAGKSLADGPFPTVIEYSGYAVADPDNPQPSTLISEFVGFATVGVNMRGSGCSGGVMGLFDLPATADGYDIVEAVAAQPWVLHGKPGMVGISFPGISQLFVGGARPPHLAAIAPLSTIADIYRAPGFPGGIFNNGFAQSWLEDRRSDAEPAPTGGQSWAIKRVNDGDETCLANQKLRLQTLDPVEFTTSHPFYVPSLMDERSPINWVARIQVPTFFSSSWQDEQTGGDFASMLNRFPKRPDVKITVQNGVHTSSLDPDVLWNWLAFLDLYVTRTAPNPGRIASIAPIIYQQILGNGTPTPPLPSDRFDGITKYEAAKALFESDPHVRVRMENGAGSPTPGLPAETFEIGFAQWPPTAIHQSIWYFGAGGSLVRARPHGDDSDADSYRPDPSVRPSQSLPGTDEDSSWEIIPPYDWAPLVDGTALAYATPPLDDDMTIVGPSSIDLWLQSTAGDTDVQVTLSEIRPDGLEAYVQNGWLRASHRKLDRRTSTKIDPRPTHLQSDASPLPFGQFSKVRVELFAVAHVFRKGSRIRISIEAPGGDRTRWAFDTPLTGGLVQNTIARSTAHASRIVLPVIPGVQAPPTLPPCPGLRGQPCRSYVPAANGG